jgi:hypothetical protein
LSFTSATITAFGALIYNDTAAGDPSVCVLDFGGAKTSTSGTFTIIFPTNDSTNDTTDDFPYAQEVQRERAHTS